MLRPNPSGAQVHPLLEIRGRPVWMSLLTSAAPVRPERRDLARRDAIVRRVVAEFRDMPGLVLTLKQASRFLGVNEAACARILTTLTQTGILRLSATEYYSKREPGI